MIELIVAAWIAGTQPTPVPTPSGHAAVQEDDPAWDCTRDGNKTCGDSPDEEWQWED